MIEPSLTYYFITVFAQAGAFITLVLIFDLIFNKGENP